MKPGSGSTSVPGAWVCRGRCEDLIALNIGLHQIGNRAIFRCLYCGSEAGYASAVPLTDAVLIRKLGYGPAPDA